MEMLRILRFVVVGSLNTGFSYLVYCLGLYLGLRYELANLVACVAGIVLGYRTHLRFVFADASAPRLWTYVAVWLSLYVLNVLIIRVLMMADLSAYVAGALAMPLIIVASYACNRWIVFRVAA